MRLMITDSGLGGLSVCGGLEQQLKQLDKRIGVELLYVNATPEDKYGYNSLKTQQERIALFDRFLQASARRFRPDLIAIACNTLSVIYDQTEFARSTAIPVMGIVETGVALCEQALESGEQDLLIFATETTTEAGTYPRLIRSNGARIIPVECSGLAHAISNDASGVEAYEIIRKVTPPALARVRPAVNQLLAFMGCTHYGYQSEQFEKVLAELGFKSTCLDPNQLLVDRLLENLLPGAAASEAGLKVQFVSRYPIPETEIASMEMYLEQAAPLTLRALNQQQVMPDLF